MKKTIKIILVIGIIAIVILCNWHTISARLWPVRSVDWQGTWVLDKDSAIGHIHAALSISDVTANTFTSHFSYSSDKDSYEDDIDVSRSTIKASRNKIIHTLYFSNGQKNIVTTYRLSHDKQTITKITDTCPGVLLIDVTPDGCEVPVDDGVYYRTHK